MGKASSQDWLIAECGLGQTFTLEPSRFSPPFFLEWKGHWGIFELEKAQTMNDEQKTEAAPATQSNFWFILIFIVMLAAASWPFLKFIFLQRRTGYPVPCISNLRQIDGAKEQWALEHKKVASDTPTDSDLIGPNRYIKVKPTCPAGGKYSYNNMATKPSCNAPSGDHTLQ